MKRNIGIFLLAAAASLGADLTGKWAGGVEIKAPDGSVRQDAAVLELKLDGQIVTGTAARADGDRRVSISNGKLDGTKVTFEIVQDDGPVFRFNLTLEGDRLHGIANADEGDRRVEIKLDLKRTQ
jgi:hypothetical protein